MTKPKEDFGDLDLVLPPFEKKHHEPSDPQLKHIAGVGSANHRNENNLKKLHEDPMKSIQSPEDKIPPFSQLHCRWPGCKGPEAHAIQNAHEEELRRHLTKHVNDYINQARARGSQGEELSCLWGLANSGNRCLPIKTDQMLEHILDHVLEQRQRKEVVPAFHHAISLPTNIIEIWNCSNKLGREEAGSSKVQRYCPGCKAPFRHETNLWSHIWKNRSFKCNHCNKPVDGMETIHMC